MYLPKPNETNFEPPPAGAHMATCCSVIDIGTQQIEWQGEKKKAHKVRVTWELPHELMDDGRPYVISQSYTFSMSERAKLRAHLESWRGRAFSEEDLSGPPNGFHMGKLIGAGCMLNILHNVKEGRTYANISAIMPLPKGMRAAPVINPSVFFSLAEFDQEVYDGLSDYLKELIGKSPEYGEIVGKRNGNGHGNGHDNNMGYNEMNPPPNDLNDEIPF